MGFSGPSLTKAIAFLRETPKVRAVLVAELGRTALTQTLLGFRNEVNPYGAEWKALADSTVSGRRKGTRKKIRKRGPKILQNTGRLKNSFTVEATDESFKLGTNVEYAVYHQQPDGPGKGIIPPRLMIPKAGHLGNWKKPMQDTARLVLEHWSAHAQ